MNKEPYLTEDGWMCYDCPQCNSSHYAPATQPHYTPAPGPQNKEDDAKIYITIFLVCIGVNIVLTVTAPFIIPHIPHSIYSTPLALSLAILSHLSGLGALVAIVTGFIKCPHNRAIKILFWISMAFIIGSILLLAIFIVACAACASGCPR